MGGEGGRTKGCVGAIKKPGRAGVGEVRKGEGFGGDGARGVWLGPYRRDHNGISPGLITY